MRVLVIGSGGREHALCRALAADPAVTALHVAPRNPGMELPTSATHWRAIALAFFTSIWVELPRRFAVFDAMIGK